MNGIAQIVVAALLGGGGLALHATGNAYVPETLRPLNTDTTQTGLMIAGGLYAAIGVATLAFNLAFDPKARRERRAAADARRGRNKFNELLTGAAVRMVGADGSINAAEMSMVQGVLEKFGQGPVAEKTIRSVAEASHSDPDRYINMMADEAGILTDDQKSSVIRACLLVAMADMNVDGSELEYLQKVAGALKVHPDRITQVREELNNVAQRLMSAAAFAA